jgi:hypothetical protein
LFLLLAVHWVLTLSFLLSLETADHFSSDFFWVPLFSRIENTRRLGCIILIHGSCFYSVVFFLYLVLIVSTAVFRYPCLFEAG